MGLKTGNGRCGDPMVSAALVPGASSWGLNPGREHVLCSWARHLTLTVPLSIQEYKIMGTAKIIVWETLQIVGE